MANITHDQVMALAEREGVKAHYADGVWYIYAEHKRHPVRVLTNLGAYDTILNIAFGLE